MRLTVGPLPPAVYWRRRAIVLGIAVIIIFLIVQSCSGGDANSVGNTATEKTTPPAAQSTGTVLRPEVEAPPTKSTPTTQPSPTAAPTTGAAAPQTEDGTCTDAEMLVTAIPELTTAQRGQTIAIRLRIKNQGKRTCTRDVGADQQELYIKRGAEKVWSSDTCGNVKGSEVKPFTPGFEREYRVDWNGHDVSKCANNLANGPIPAAGDYQVFARLGTKTSNPVKLTLQ